MSDNKTVEGHVVHIGETQTFGSSGFRKRELVVETEEQYPQKIMIEFVQNMVDMLDDVAEGMKVRVSINLRGREWVSPAGETKYFNSIQAWKLESMESQTQKPLSEQYLEKQKSSGAENAGDDFLKGKFEMKEQESLNPDDYDDLPF